VWWVFLADNSYFISFNCNNGLIYYNVSTHNIVYLNNI
jgi:hypothetical protein